MPTSAFPVINSSSWAKSTAAEVLVWAAGSGRKITSGIGELAAFKMFWDLRRLGSVILEDVLVFNSCSLYVFKSLKDGKIGGKMKSQDEGEREDCWELHTLPAVKLLPGQFSGFGIESKESTKSDPLNWDSIRPWDFMRSFCKIVAARSIVAILAESLVDESLIALYMSLQTSAALSSHWWVWRSGFHR